MQKYALAITDCSKAIKINPQYANAYNARGDAYYGQGKYELAIADYNKAIELKYDPLSQVYNNRGITYYQQGNYQQAIADYNKAIQIDPNYAEAYYYRGLSRSYLREKQAAIQDLKKAADLYKKQGNIKDSQDALEKIKELQQ